jgi:hypothetical protein
MKHIINATHNAFNGVLRSLRRRKLWAAVMFLGALLAMVAASSGIALMSGSVFKTILDNEILAMTIAILQHLGLAIGVDLLTRGYARCEPIYRIAGWIVVSICLTGILFITIARGFIRVQDGLDPFRAWSYSILFGLIEIVIPAAFGFLNAVAHLHYGKVRWLWHKSAHAGHYVLADHHNPATTWKLIVDQWTKTVEKLQNSASKQSGDRYNQLLNRAENWVDLIREHEPALIQRDIPTADGISLVQADDLSWDALEMDKQLE